MAASDKITILLAGEDTLCCENLAAVLQETPHFEVIAQCQDGEAAFKQIRELRPDIAVVDLNLPKLHGIELVRQVRGEALGTRIVILSDSTDDHMLSDVVRAGGDAYLMKSGPARHLIDAVSHVWDGGQYFFRPRREDSTGAFPRKAMQRKMSGPDEDATLSRKFNDLEARLPQLIEAEVTSRFDNMANKLREIEETHVRTIETFVRNIFAKLVERVSALETLISKHAEEMRELREYSQNTERALSRLITGVENLTREFPAGLPAPEPAPWFETGPTPTRSGLSRLFSMKMFWIAAAAIVILIAGVVHFRNPERSGKLAASGPPAIIDYIQPNDAAVDFYKEVLQAHADKNEIEGPNGPKRTAVQTKSGRK